MNLKQRQEAARRIAASVKEAIELIRSDGNAGYQIVWCADDPGHPPNAPLN